MAKALLPALELQRGREHAAPIFAYLTFRFPDVSGDKIAQAMGHVGSKRNQIGSGARGYTKVGAR